MKVVAEFSHLNIVRRQFDDGLATLKKTAAEYETTIDMINLVYRAPCDTATMDLGDASIDLHISTNVLEHVPPVDIKRLYRNTESKGQRGLMQPEQHLAASAVRTLSKLKMFFGLFGLFGVI